MKTFKEIREQYPTEFLLLFDCEEQQSGPMEIEVLGAKEVQASESGDEMWARFQELQRQGVNVHFCTPQYTDRFQIKQIPMLSHITK